MKADSLRNRICSGHPELSLVWTLGVLFLSLWVPQVSGILLCLLATLVQALWWRRLPLRRLLGSFRIPALFACLGAASLPVEISWEQAAPWVTFSGPESLVHAGTVLLRSFSAILAMLTLFHTERIEGLLAAFGRRGVPEPVVDIAFLVYSTIHDLAASLEKMQMSADARLGFSGIRNRVRTAGLIAAGLWVQALVMARSKQVGFSTRGLETCSLFSAVETPRLTLREFLGVAMLLATLAALPFFWEGAPR